jgi:membrane-associated protease RseP (regulator of RpoE activity)
MIRKSLIIFLLGAAAGAATYAQQTPPPQRDDAPRAFAWSFDGDGGYLGVQTQEVTRENFAKLGLRDVRGVAVEKVLEKSPAESAGIQAGDVIVRFNGEEVTSARKLTRLISEVDPDHQAKLTVIRGGSEREVTVTVGKRPMPALANGNFEFKALEPGQIPDLKNFPQLQNMPDPQVWQNLPKGDFKFEVPNGPGQTWVFGTGRQIGVGITPLTKQLADHFRVVGGAMINEVRDDSPAAKAGLKAGDIIVEANGQPVKNQMDLIRIVNEKKDGDVQVTIVRDGNRQTLTVTPEATKDGNFFFQTDDDGGLTPPATPRAPRGLRQGQPGTPGPPAAPLPRLAMPGRIV